MLKQNKKRKPITEMTDGTSVEAEVQEQSPKNLLKILRDENYGNEVSDMWSTANNDRSAWLERQEAFLDEYDEFITPIYNSPADWSANLHLPIAFTISKTFHARFYQAIFSQDPPFTVTARKEANTDREQTLSDLLRYTVKDWANDYTGIEDEIDKWLWHWVTRGVGIMKMGWEKRYQKFKDVVTETIQIPQTIMSPDGMSEVVMVPKENKVERDVVELDFDGPLIKHINPEDIVIIGGGGDPDKADAVIESVYMTASELYSLVDRGVFDKAAVEATIEHGNQRLGNTQNEGIKNYQANNAGYSTPDSNAELQRYRVLEAYIKKDVYESGINSELVVWVDESSKQILRANFLNRVNSKTRKRPYAKIDFYKRDGQTYGIGLIELTYSICKEIDAINNMKQDFGLLSTMPFGYYRATSSMSVQSLPIEPGVLIPLDDPTRDVYFPQLGNRTGYGNSEIQFLYSLIERLTGLSDLNYGVLGAQGAARTASGVQAIMSESNTNLDIFLRRINRGMKKLLNYTSAMLQDKMPPGMEFRVLGNDGQAYFRQIKSRNEIAGKFDFELEPNSAASNPSVRLNTAQQVYSLVQNPLALQLGIVTPGTFYEAMKGLMISMGIKDYSKYITKPQGFTRNYTPEEIVNRRLAGVPLKLDPTMDVVGVLTYIEEIMSNDDLLGQFSEQGAIQLAQLAQEAQQLQQAMEQMAQQKAVASQMQSNAANSLQQTAQQAAPQGAMPSEQPAAPPAQ
jgi:hypothetical protein